MPGIVYVVDDDPSFRTAIQRLLEKTGYRVQLTDSESEASRESRECRAR